MFLAIAYVGVALYISFTAAISHVLPDVEHPVYNPPAPTQAASAPEAK